MPIPTEEEVLAKIAALEESRQHLKDKMSYLKKSILNIETDLIGVKINLDKLQEELKKIRHNK